MLARITPAIVADTITIVIIAITGISPAHRAGSAAWRRCMRGGSRRHPGQRRIERHSCGHGPRRSSFGSSNIVAEARRFIGGNPTGSGRLWCARFMNLVLQHSGYRGTGSDMARSFASYGQRVSGPQVGAIAVMARRGGGHVGVVSGIDASGNPIVVSGNNGNRVREAPISRGRIYAYVMPTG